MHLTLDSQSQTEALVLPMPATQWRAFTGHRADPAALAHPREDELTIHQAFERWFSQYLHLRKDGGESVRRSMMKDVLPHLGHRSLISIQREDLTAVLNYVIERGSPRQAGCVLADMRQLLRWALREGLIDNDPSAGLHKNAFSGDATVRSRALSVEEVAELAGKVVNSGLADHIRTAVWLMLATGARIGEVATARWQDIDPHHRTWTIPAHLSQSGRVHVIPLSKFAMTHLASADGQRRSPVWIFPSRNDSEPLCPKALGKQIRDRQRGVRIRGRSAATTMLLLSGGAWTPLDLRRTAISLMTQLGVGSATLSACLDQSPRGLTELETGSNNPEACRSAFDKLGEFLEHIARSGLTHGQGKA